jgi:hypothetical protein
MPFPVDPERITAAECELDFAFPTAWRRALEHRNGGEVPLGDDVWRVYPVWDDSDRRHAGRTANHVVRETNQARSWPGFPAAAIALASNDCGDLLVALPGSASVWLWDHELGSLEDLGDLDPLGVNSASRN